MDTVEFFVDALGDWRWRYHREDGEMMADSAEGYVTRAEAIAAAEYLFLATPTDDLQFTFEDDD